MDQNIEKYFFVPKPLEALIENAIVVIDTNVLLSAYQWKEITFKEVIEKLKKLSETNRLRIPEHVLEEFVNERPKRINDLLKDFNDRIKSKVNSASRLSSTIPLLELLPEHQKYTELEIKYQEIAKEYAYHLNTLQNDIRGFFNNDPVLEALRPIFKKDCFTNIDKKCSQLLKEATERKKNKQPPLTGGDDSKKINEYGDYFIWKDILSLNTDVIFVSNDVKEDWYYVQNKKALSPRRELIEEFFELNDGSTCCIVNLSEFMKIENPEITNEVLYDLETNVDVYDPSNVVKWARYRLTFVVKNEPKMEIRDRDALQQLSAILDFDDGIIDYNNIWTRKTELDSIYMDIEVNILASHLAATDAINEWFLQNQDKYRLEIVEWQDI
ncbi:PIN domain-containing protein [Paenibacillus sp. PsM32]|uniref:PIN-like domain-containing protein n=1 Tax=unclassified Paenibacillus TaxID=185978 RepID=UPI0023650011|nr:MULTISPECIES: PIN-like domain-containing protein [unclassified Paenibacillus]MDN4617632.1 PIN domain-containing protein [Paenibacillus sp. PsM32]WDF52911.1 PIN domain-containing protein [Paenibacillus sp. KACC 21273]